MHIVISSEQRVLRKHSRLVRRIIQKAATKWGVNIYEMSIMPDHIHLLVRVPSRLAYRFFIQWVTGAIALILKIKWKYRPFTRVVAWGLGYRRAKNYVKMNELEAQGEIVHQPRGRGAYQERMWLSGEMIAVMAAAYGDH